MRLIPANLRKIASHREKPDGITVEFSLGQTEALLSRTQELIPFDSPDVSKDWVKKAVEKGELNSAVLQVDGEEVGLMTFAVVESRHVRELLVVTACIESKKLPYLPLLNTYAEKIARHNGCKFIRFHTVRKGLIKESIKLGFYVSEIVLRRPL